MKRIKAETHNHEKGRWSLKELLQQKETQLNQLRDQLKYKDQKLVSKELEMESYKKTAEERIFKLEAKIKELEAKLSNQPSGLTSSSGFKPFQNVQKKGGVSCIEREDFLIHYGMLDSLKEKDIQHYHHNPLISLNIL